MMPGDDYSVYVAKTSTISGTLRPGIDFLNDKNGYFYGQDAVTINKATDSLVPYLVNSLSFDEVGVQKEVHFMSDQTGGFGGDKLFNEPTKTITMLYGTDIRDLSYSNGTKTATDGAYYFTIKRYKLLSEALEGEAGMIAKWMEDNREKLLSDAYNNEIHRELLELYSKGDMSYDAKDAEELFDGENLVPDTATKRLNAINENWMDISDSALAQRLTVHNMRTELIPLTADFRDGLWITPIGTIMNIYPDEKLARAFYSGAGLNIGFAGFLNNNSSYGLGLTYVNGYYDDGNTNFGKFDTSLFAGTLGYRTNPGLDKTWIEGIASYAQSTTDAYGAFDKNSSDIYRAGIKAGVDVVTGQNWRITPAVGVDYTYYDNNKPMIDTGLVQMNVKDTESLCPQAEVEAVYNTKETTRFGMKIGYSYEAMGKGIEQEMYLLVLLFLSARQPSAPRATTVI